MKASRFRGFLNVVAYAALFGAAGNRLAAQAAPSSGFCGGQTTTGNGQFCVDNFPSNCTVASVPYTTKLDCADATAVQYLIATGSGPVLYFGSPNSYYLTNAGVLLAPASWTGDAAISLQGSGEFNTAILLQSPNSTAAVYLPLSTGANNRPKHFYIADMTIQTEWDAPYALAVLGYHYQSQFTNLVLRSGTVSNGIWGSNANNSWGYQDTFTNVWGINSGCPIANGCGSGATGTVSLANGAPSIAITAGGTRMDANTQAWLVGYQQGTALNPCATMGTIAVAISGGAVTSATPSGFSHCSGAVYVVFDDDPQQFGLNFNDITDSTMTDVKSQSGYEAGVVVEHGENAFYHLHSFPIWGKFCVENHGANSYESFEMGECSLAQIDNAGIWPTAIAVVTSAGFNHASYAYQGQSMFRNEMSADQIYARDVFCNTINANEYHTLVTPGGVIDSNSAAETSPGDEMANIQYCGSGVGGTLNFTSRSFLSPSVTIPARAGRNKVFSDK